VKQRKYKIARYNKSYMFECPGTQHESKYKPSDSLLSTCALVQQALVLFSVGDVVLCSKYDDAKFDSVKNYVIMLMV